MGDSPTQQTESAGKERLLLEVRKYTHIASHTQRKIYKVEGKQGLSLRDVSFKGL